MQHCDAVRMSRRPCLALLSDRITERFYHKQRKDRIIPVKKPRRGCCGRTECASGARGPSSRRVTCSSQNRHHLRRFKVGQKEIGYGSSPRARGSAKQAPGGNERNEEARPAAPARSSTQEPTDFRPNDSTTPQREQKKTRTRKGRGGNVHGTR